MSNQPKTNTMSQELIDEVYDDEYSYSEIQEARSYARLTNFDLSASEFESEWE
jgi:hypothetical protein